MSQRGYQRGRAHTALAVLNQFKEKIARGIYPTEAAVCFCGADNDTVLVEKDRQGLPHRIVVCEECGLVRANPRMTAGAYHEFYNNEYRQINYPFHVEGSSSHEEDEATLLDLQIEKSKELLVTLATFDIPRPKVVVDIGCHLGGSLLPFRDKGADVWGVEISEDAAAKARARGITVVSSIDELIALGVKADFVILQDVIEHLLDLREVEKIGKILLPEGHLYIFTPGFFRTESVGRLWQVAHTFQFCAHTLEYVMGEMGFNEVFLDEEIVSLWTYVGLEQSFKFVKPKEWAEYIKDDIFVKEKRRMPPFRGTCKFTPKTLYENIDLNLAKKVPDLYEISKKYSGSVMIVGGGPSVDGQIEKIKELQEQGSKLMVISRMYPWCKANSLCPDFVVSLDCMEEQEKGFSELQPGVIYLLASVTRPSIFELVAKETRYIWDTKDDAKVQAMRRKHGYEVATVINGGGSITVGCLSLAMNLGFRNLHVFGLDCMIPKSQQSHASGISGDSVAQHQMIVEIDVEEILTSGPYLEFARQSLDLVSAGHDEGLLDSVEFYGESLITKMWDGVFSEEPDVKTT